MELIQTFKKSYFLKMSDDKHLIAQVNSSQINIFENETYKHLAQFKEVGNASVFFSNDSNLLLAKDNDRKLVVYDLATMSIRCKLKPKVGSSNGDGDACISHDNKYIINLGYDFPYGYISVYDIENGKETRFREDMREVYNQIRYIPSRQLYFIDGFRRPNEGTSEKNRYFYLWFDMDNRTFEQTFCDLDDANFLYSEHLEQVLYFTEEGNLAFRILPLNIELPIKHQQGCLDIQLSHNNKMIALYQDNNLKLCTFPNMEILAELSNIGYGNISFSPDDKEILIASTIKGLIYKLEKCS